MKKKRKEKKRKEKKRKEINRNQKRKEKKNVVAIKIESEIMNEFFFPPTKLCRNDQKIPKIKALKNVQTKSLAKMGECQKELVLTR